MSELTIVLKVEVDDSIDSDGNTVGKATVVRVGAAGEGTADAEPTVILVRLSSQ